MQRLADAAVAVQESGQFQEQVLRWVDREGQRLEDLLWRALEEKFSSFQQVQAGDLVHGMGLGQEHVTSLGHQTTGLADLVLHVPWIQEELQRLKDRQTTQESDLSTAREAWPQLSHQLVDLREEVTYLRRKELAKMEAVLQSLAPVEALQEFGRGFSALEVRIQRAEASLENMSRKMEADGSEAKDESQQALRTVETRLQQTESTLEGISGEIRELQAQSQPKDAPIGRAPSQTAAAEGATEASESVLSMLQERIDKAEASLENMSRKMQVESSEFKDESQQALRTLETRLQQAESALETISKKMPQGEDAKSALSPNAPKTIEWFAPEPELNVRLRHLERRLGEEASNVICLSQKLDQVRSTALISEERISALCLQAKALLDSGRDSSEA